MTRDAALACLRPPPRSGGPTLGEGSRAASLRCSTRAVTAATPSARASRSPAAAPAPSSHSPTWACACRRAHLATARRLFSACWCAQAARCAGPRASCRSRTRRWRRRRSGGWRCGRQRAVAGARSCGRRRRRSAPRLSPGESTTAGRSKGSRCLVDTCPALAVWPQTVSPGHGEPPMLATLAPPPPSPLPDPHLVTSPRLLAGRVRARHVHLFRVRRVR